MAQYNFSDDWNRFFDELSVHLSDRQTFEKEYNSICRKARSLEYDNQTDSACYYYMAAVLCYLFYDDPANPDDDRKWAIDMGKSSIKKALTFLQDDEEFLSLSLVFDLLGLQYFDESSINLKSLFQKIQSIKHRCPHIESIENSLIKNDFLRKWFNDAYSTVLGMMLYCKDMDEDKQLKIGCASELLISSSDTFHKMAAYESLADAFFDIGNYEESQRYAILGKDLLGSLSEYNHDDMLQRLWGICWHIYAKCQEEFGDKDFAMALFEKGMSLGIPWCEKELEKLKQNNKENSIENLDGGMSLTEKERKEYANRINSPFSMEIEDVWELEEYPKNPMALGRIWSGVIKKGDKVVIVNDDRKHEATVLGVAMFDKILDEAEAGDACGIILLGVDIDKVQIGSMIRKLS